MAVTIVGIRLSVSGDAQVKGALAGAEKSLAGVQSAAADASQSLRNLAGAFAGAVTVGAFIKAADSVTILNNQLKLATGSADAAATAYASLFDIAQRSRVSFTELGGTFATISRAAESLKLSQSALLGVTEAIGNAMTISGGSAESMKAALVQLGQGLASGTLRGEELNSILEQTPRLAKALADGLGVSIGALRKLGEEGKLSAEAVITALRSQQSALATEVAQSATTVGQALQQLQNAVTVAVGDFDKASGSTGALATGIQAVATTIGELRRAFSGLEESKTDFTAFGEGVGAVMRTMTLGFTTTLTGIRQLGVGAAGLAAAGVALASGNVAGAREAMRAAGEDIDLLGSKWMAQSDAIINSAGSVARATEVNAQAMARLARQGTAATESIKPLDFSKLVGGVDKAKKKVDEFAAALSKVTAKDVGLSADYEKTLAALYSGFVKGRIGVDAYAEAVESLIKQQPFYIAGVRDAAEAEKDRIKALDDATKSTAQYYEALQKELGALEANIEKLTLENEQIGLSKESVVQLTLARMDEAIATEEQTLAMLTLHEAAGEEIKLIERRIALMKQERSLTASNSTKQTTADAAKDAAKEWEKTTNKINDTLTDALMRGFESGKGFAENLRDTVENMFKTLVLRPIVSAVVNPVAGAITAGLGLPGAASAATTGTSALSGLGSLGELGGSLGALGTGLGAGAGMIAGGGVGGWLTASTSLIGTGTAAGAMAGIGALAGPIGAALAVASFLKGLDDSGTMHTGGLGSYSAARGASVGDAVKSQGLMFDLSSTDYSASTAQASVGMAKTVAGMLDSTAATFGQKAGYFAATAGADDTSDDGGWGALMVKLGDQVLLDWKNGTDKWPGREFSDGEAGAKEYAAAVSRDVRNLLIEQTPDWADAMLNALGDAPTLEQLATTVGQINQVQMALASMGRASEAFAQISEAALSTLVSALGGAEASVAKLSGYYSNFYTESERVAISTQALKSEMAAFGVEMPNTRAAFRGLVDAAIAAGDPTLAASLINVEARFAAIVPAAEDASIALEKQAAAAAKAAEDATKAAEDAMKTARSNALRQLEASVARESALWQKQADAASALRDEVGAVFDTLATNITELRRTGMGDVASAAQGNQFIQAALQNAKAGLGLPDVTDLANAIQNAKSGLGMEQFATVADQKFAALKLAGELDALKGVAGEQLTGAERQLRVAEEQLALLQETSDYWRTLLDGTQAGIDATMSVADAVRALQALVPQQSKYAGQSTTSVPTGVSAGTLGASFGAGASSVQAQPASVVIDDPNKVRDGTPYERAILSDSLLSGFGADLGWAGSDALGRHRTELEDTLISEVWRYREMGSQDGFQGYFKGRQDQYQVALESLRGAGIPGFANGGNHSGGLRLVGERGWEVEATGPARYWNQEQLGRVISGGSQDMAEIVAELRALRAQVDDLNRHSRRTAEAINGNPEAPIPMVAA